MNLFACGFCGKPVLERRASRGSQWTQQVLPTYPLVSCLRIGALIDFGATANFLQLRAIDGTRICPCPKCKHWKGRWVSDSSNRCVCGSLPLACPMSRTRGVTRPASHRPRVLKPVMGSADEHKPFAKGRHISSEFSKLLALGPIVDLFCDRFRCPGPWR